MEAMISFYVIEGTAGGGARLHAPSRRKVTVRHMAPFVPLHENSVTLKLSPLTAELAVLPAVVAPPRFWRRSAEVASPSPSHAVRWQR